MLRLIRSFLRGVNDVQVEAITKLQAFRGFAGTSVLILVGVATDTARKFRAELAMQKYKVCAEIGYVFIYRSHVCLCQHGQMSTSFLNPCRTSTTCTTKCRTSL